MLATSEPPRWASSYIGRRFEQGASGPDVFDCYGLYRIVRAEQFGELLPLRAVLSMSGVGEAIRADIESGEWASIESPDVGDAAIFRIGDDLGHIGMVVARERMLHITRGAQSAIERYTSPAWSARFAGFYRYVGQSVQLPTTTSIGGTIAHVVVAYGQSLEDILAGFGIRCPENVVVEVGGVDVGPDWWARVRPKAGQSITVSRMVAGSEEGKTPARIALTIGVVAAAALVPALAVQAWGLTAGSFAAAATQAAVGTGIAIGGTLLTNALAPLATPKFNALSGDRAGLSPTLSGTRNEIRQYAPFPRVLGTHRIYPPFGAKPYTEQLGDDEYLRVLYNCGYGELLLSDFKIGDTPIEEFDGVEIEVRAGIPGEDSPQLVPGNVTQEDVGVELIQSEGFTLRTSATNTDEISLDFLAPAGLAALDRANEPSTVGVALTIQYRAVGDTDWLDPAGLGVAPRGRRAMDIAFREPESIRLGSDFVDDVHPLQWSGNGTFEGDKPDILPDEAFAVQIEGYVYIPNDTPFLYPAGGPVRFALECSDAAELYIDGKLVLSSYGPRTAAASGSAPAFADIRSDAAFIPKGRHRIMVRLYATDGNPGDVAVGWAFGASATDFVTIPASQLSVYGVGPFGPTGNSEPGKLKYTWYDASGYTSNVELSDNRTEPFRKTFTFGVDRGQYEVRVRRDTADDDSISVVDEVYWRTFRSIRNEDPIALDGVSKVALRIKASNQLSGVLDTFNCIATSILPDYDPDTGEWLPSATSNPAAIYRAALQAQGSPINNNQGADDEDLDLATLEEWWIYCDENGFTFNAVYDFEATVGEALQDIASAGRASYGIDSQSRFTVVIDREKPTPLQHFTPRNSSNIRGRASFADRPHGLKVQFISREANWQRAERIVLDDGYAYDYDDGNGPVDAFGEPAPELPLATLFDVVEMFGVDNADLAWKAGRYQIAVARLRPETVTFNTDIEHLAVSRGDPFLLSADALLVGLGTGRIARLDFDEDDNVVAVALDEKVRMGSDADYGLRIRSSRTGDVFLVPVVAEEGETDTLTLANPIPFDEDPIPMIDDLATFGEFGTESLDLIVAAVNMGTDLSATITAVSNAAAVHLADQGEIPDWNPNITDPPDVNLNPDAPIIVAVRSDDYVMVRGADGSLQPRIVITIARPLARRPRPDYAEVQIRAKPTGGVDPAGPFREIGPVSIENQTISIDGVDELVTYEVRIRVVTNAGRASEWVEFEETVTGKTLPPPVVEDFDVVRLSDGTRRFVWDLGLIPPDIAGVVIRYGVGGQGLLWEQLDPLHTEVLQGSPQELNLPGAGLWTFGIKMEDTSGNQSTAALLIDRTLGPPREEDVALSEEAYSLGWPGTKTDCAVDGVGYLVVDDESTWATAPATWAAFLLWTGNPKGSMVYEHPALDIGFVLDFIPAASAQGLGDFLIEYRYRSSTGDAWSDYEEVDPLNEVAITGRYVQYRITVTAQVADQILYLSRFLMQVRAPTKSIDIQDLDTSAVPLASRYGVGDIRLPINSSTFNVIRTISVSFNGTGAGYTWEVVDKNVDLGPRIRIFGPDGLAADAIIDAVIRGV